MTLRIKLPAIKAAESAPLSQSGEVSLPPQARRKPMKRRHTVGSDEDDYDENEGYVKRPRRTATVDSAEEDVEEEVEVDVEDTVDDQGHNATSSTSRKSASRFVKSTLRDAQPAQKKRRLPVASEPDTEDEYVDRGGDEDDEFVAEPERDRPLKGKGKVLGKIPKHAKGKTKSESVDERRKGTEIAGKRPRPKLKGEDDGAGESVVSPDTPNANLTHSPPSAKEEAPPPKKRKLPPIKKNKSAASTGPATPSTTATTATKPAPPPGSKANNGVLDGSILPLPTLSARKPAGLAGQTDFDLRNQDVYNLLFKNTGGSTPRSGLSRREKNEERQRELNKMREEAKAKRELEAKHSFDLQGQTEKIARFEERLRRERNSVLWPNALAAKWRDIWEREKRRVKEHETQATEGREEGEMTEGL